MRATVAVKGLRELQRAFTLYAADLGQDFNKTLNEAAEEVAVEARSRFQLSPVGGSTRSAQSFKPRLRGFLSAAVYQSRRKVTGRRGDYGALQMRKALLPALYSKSDEIVHECEGMLVVLKHKHGF